LARLATSFQLTVTKGQTYTTVEWQIQIRRRYSTRQLVLAQAESERHQHLKNGRLPSVFTLLEKSGNLCFIWLHPPHAVLVNVPRRQLVSFPVVLHLLYQTFSPTPYFCEKN
jgi:hypothetical protein